MGAGPSGLAAAINVTANGYDAEVFEKNLFLGGNIRTDVQAIRAYGNDSNIMNRLKEYGIKLKHCHPIYRVKRYSPSNRFDLVYSNDAPIFYTVKRGTDFDSLDSQLISIAESQGTKVNFGQPIKINDAHIISSGSRFDPAGIGFGAVFENANFDNNSISFFYGNEQIQSGYGYVAPFGKNYLTISITSFKKTDFPHIKKNFEEFITSNPVIKEITENASKISEFAGFGHFNIPKTAVHNHKYFTGGAAGFVDPARGFGLKYALLSGVFAAQAITSNLDYDKLWQDDFKNELYDGYGRRLFLDSIRLKDYEKFVSGTETNIKEYQKVPNDLKNTLININAKLNVEGLRKKYSFDKLF